MIGTFTAESNGSGEIDFDSQDSGGLPPSLNPVDEIQTVEIRDASGSVLMGSF